MHKRGSLSHYKSKINHLKRTEPSTFKELAQTEGQHSHTCGPFRRLDTGSPQGALRVTGSVF